MRRVALAKPSSPFCICRKGLNPNSQKFGAKPADSLRSTSAPPLHLSAGRCRRRRYRAVRAGWPQSWRANLSQGGVLKSTKSRRRRRRAATLSPPCRLSVQARRSSHVASCLSSSFERYPIAGNSTKKVQPVCRQPTPPPLLRVQPVSSTPLSAPPKRRRRRPPADSPSCGASPVVQRRRGAGRSSEAAVPLSLSTAR